MIYVEKEALINKFIEAGACLSKDQIIYLINRLPTTDIVTCKECDNIYKQDPCGDCESGYVFCCEIGECIEPNNYCSFGERREE